MKQPKSRDRLSAARRALPANVDEYLAGVPQPARDTLSKIRSIIRSVVPPEAVEVISYRVPMWKYKGLLVGFAAFSGHCSLFPGDSVIKAFESELKDYSTSKGTIRFPVDRPLPAALVKKLVKARIAENERRTRR